MRAYKSKARNPKDKTFRKLFAREYVKNGFNGKRAYLTLRPHVTEKTASVNSSALAKTEEVQREIQRITDKVSVEYVLEGIERIAREAKKDDTKLNALVHLGRYLAMFKDQATTQTAVINAIDLESIKRELERKEPKSLPANELDICASDNKELCKAQPEGQDESYRTNTEGREAPEGAGTGEEPPVPPLI